MSYVFGRKMSEHAKIQLQRLNPRNRAQGPVIQWPTAQNEKGSLSTVEIPRTPKERGSVILEVAPEDVGPSDFDKSFNAAGKIKVRDMMKGTNPDVIEAC